VVHGGIKQQDMIKTGINGNFSAGGGEFSTFKTGIPGVPGNDVTPLASDLKKIWGILIDNTLAFTVHINHVVAKAFARANLISKCFILKDISTLMHASNVYVRPLLEYASCVWSPYHDSKITQTLRVQRRFIKRLPGFAGIT
jgi:hypothetical protein